MWLRSVGDGVDSDPTGLQINHNQHPRRCTNKKTRIRKNIKRMKYKKCKIKKNEVQKGQDSGVHKQNRL